MIPGCQGTRAGNIFRLLLALAALPAVIMAASNTVVVKRIVVNAGTAAAPFPVNSYLVCHPQSRSAVLIDPGANDDRFAAGASEQGVQVRMILNTHCHLDHSAGRVPSGRGEKKALQSLVDVIRRRLLTLPADTPVWPGHGRPTNIGEEALLNPFLR